MIKYDEAFEVLIGHEGGYQKKWGDRGNWTKGIVGAGELKGTKFGISAMTYPHLDIVNLTVEQAKAIYYKDFWLKSSGDLLSEGIAYQVFDTAVNSGVRRANKLLQQSLGVTQDGAIGPQSQAAIKAADHTKLALKFAGYRLLFMTSLVSLFKTWGRGWVKRVAHNMIKTGNI